MSLKNVCINHFFWLLFFAQLHNVCSVAYCTAKGKRSLPSAHKAFLCHPAHQFCMKLCFHSIDLCFDSSFEMFNTSMSQCCLKKKEKSSHYQESLALQHQFFKMFGHKTSFCFFSLMDLPHTMYVYVSCYLHILLCSNPMLGGGGFCNTSAIVAQGSTIG